MLLQPSQGASQNLDLQEQPEGTEGTEDEPEENQKLVEAELERARADSVESKATDTTITQAPAPGQKAPSKVSDVAGSVLSH
jgi:hypothetical protein